MRIQIGPKGSRKVMPLKLDQTMRWHETNKSTLLGVIMVRDKVL